MSAALLLGLVLLAPQQTERGSAGPDVLHEAKSHDTADIFLSTKTGVREPEGWFTRSARQHLPQYLDGGCLSVASASARGGWAVPPASDTPVARRPVNPVLDFPEPGLDDTAAYQGYQTRFYRDSKENTVQIYLEPRGGRVVQVWADAANESVGFTVRDGAGRAAPLTWDGRSAEVVDSGAYRTIEYRLRADASRLELGWFLLGSMRVERDFVYAQRHLKPFGPAFQVAEESLLVANVVRLPPAERARHLAVLGARNVAELRSRLRPTIVSFSSDTGFTVHIERPSLDGRNHLALELRVDPRRAKVQASGGTVSIRTRPGSPIRLAVKTTTDAAPLTPLRRNEIFNRDFLTFLEKSRVASDSADDVRYRRMERQVRGVELLSSQEKLMAGLPNFATYFGRDMMMTALMMRPIWSPVMAEHVIASVLQKLGPRGDVSHEEALGGQAIRENAAVYDSLVTEYFRVVRHGRREGAESTLDRAREVLMDLHKTRENYHMVDDEFHLPVLEARYLTDSAVPAARKRAFLLESNEDGASRLKLMLQEMALVAQNTRPYVQSPRTTNMVGFPRRDSTHWRSASWRDSDAGYAGGRFAMDINVIWVPEALQAIADILRALPQLGLSPQTINSVALETGRDPLSEYLRDTTTLRQAIDTWKQARRHFAITLGPEQIRQKLQAKLAWLPQSERILWSKVLAQQGEGSDSLRFLVLSLDAEGRRIPVVNTDPATELFLNATATSDQVLAEVAPILRPYPIGLFVEGLGPLVANDAYASRTIWDRFRTDPYHGPRVVWGREVNLLLLGLANQISGAVRDARHSTDPALASYIRALTDALRRTLHAVNASGLQHNELWSYEIRGGRLLPVRYGTSSDVQLWNTTNLVVQYVLSTLPAD